MIKELKVEKLNGRFDYEFKFYGDLNLFTGTIGTGKTTLLKLIWFLTSGNLHRVISEIRFNFVSIDTSEFFLSMEHIKPNQVKLILSFTEVEGRSEVLLALKREASGFMVLEQQETVDEPNKSIARVMKSSQFFPTFRRMERHVGDEFSSLQSDLSALANALSVDDHKWIIAASTYDVIDLLTQKKTEIDKGKGAVDFKHETLVQRWEFLNELVKEIFGYPGIRITDNIVLGGDADKDGDYISSPYLSSGEKHLLGFLCYNAFSKPRTVFIDEPELSLHPDWQRLLITLLEYQGTEKQFFIASHSPYIGMKYEEKEFPLRRPKNE